MSQNAFRLRTVLCAAVLLCGSGLASLVTAQTPPRTDTIRQKLFDADAGVFVVAHRGCHNPTHDRGAAPENSLAALEKCVALGVDMMETDVRRAKDGTLVIMHDDTVDRTTDGHGLVADLTISQIKALHLRQNFGGTISPEVTDQQVLTLDELLAAAKDRIMINLDIKEAIYPQVIAAAVRAGVASQVLVKSVVESAAPPLGDQAPYDATPYIPILSHNGAAPFDNLSAIVASQFAAKRRPPAVEIVFLTPAEFSQVRAAALPARIRLWANTLTSVGVVGIVGVGGDVDALRDHGATWGRQIKAGISVFQTDEPDALIAYLRARK